MKETFLLLLLLIFTKVATSQSIRQLDAHRYWAGIPQSELSLMQALSVNGGKQMQSRWCWAASIQIVLNYHGLSSNQKDIVAQLYGSSEINKGADELQILETLSSWKAFQNGKRVKVLAKGGLHSPQNIITALAYKWPLIVGFSTQEEHHALVLTAIEYAIIPPNNQLLPLRVKLYDPWPEAPTFQEIDWPEFQEKCSAVIKIMLVR